ncbi:hypothetical protein XA68_12355 [Ophiocordyceps unilateralis]|uniref:TauD/TfdA-like domain-containing protein n=1 Tax=Ophiocordyceps unilateralis TaxID=268505 RepID=A0A2A9PT19_OPHUN|nr:hypothetical protein XA68_12355 [Ophiocordyceps unilateralis]
MASRARVVVMRGCVSSRRGIRTMNIPSGGNSSIEYIVTRTASGRFPSNPPTSYPRRIPKYLERFRYRLPMVTMDGETEPGSEVQVEGSGGDSRAQTRKISAEAAAARPQPLDRTKVRALVQALKQPKDEDVTQEDGGEPPAPRQRKPRAGSYLDDWPVMTVAWTTETLYVEDEQRTLVKELQPAAIRDNCVCPSCRDADSGNKLFNSSQIPADISIESARATDDGIWVKFINDTAGHGETLVTWDTVEVALRRRGSREGFFPRRPSILGQTGMLCWDRPTLEGVVRAVDYETYMSGADDDAALWDVIIDLCRLGIVFVRGVPLELDAVEAVATRIANLRETLYGRVFDVRAGGGQETASNVAYTSRALHLHQDLLYLDPPPMIQVLHCLDNSCPGGDSIFADAERIGRLLWPFVRVSERLAPLANRPVDYHYRGADHRHPPHRQHYYHASRPVLAHEPLTGFTRVSWSPPFQAPSQLADQQLQHWIRAAGFFESLISDAESVYRVRLQPGDCVLFDNRRVLHGRDAFDLTSGQRWLRGTYIAAEDFLSRATQIPAAQAHHYRGENLWSSVLENQDLRHSDWRKKVSLRVLRFDPAVDERLVR